MKPQYWLEERYLKDKLVHTELHREFPDAEILKNLRIVYKVEITQLVNIQHFVLELKQKLHRNSSELLGEGDKYANGDTEHGFYADIDELDRNIDELAAEFAVCTAMRPMVRAAIAQPVAVDAPIGAVLAYDTNGHSKPCGQTMGANGAGQFVVVFHGTIEQSDAAAREHIRRLEHAGYRFNTCLLVNAEEGYHGPVITHVNSAIDVQDGEAT